MTLKLTTLDKFTVLAFAAQMVLAGNTAINGPMGDIPVHFDISGQANGWADRTELAVMIAGMAILGLILGGGLAVAAARAGEAGAERRQRGLKTAQTIILIAFSVIALMTVTMSLRILGNRGGGPGTMMVMLGLLLATLGALLGRVGPNPWVGVRTPWAYKSRNAWDRSNRLLGRMWFVGGIGAVALSAVAPQPLGMQSLIGFVIATALVAVFESWRVWRTDPDRQPF